MKGTTKVTQAVLPAMLKRKKGAIVNIGSMFQFLIDLVMILTVCLASLTVPIFETFIV